MCRSPPLSTSTRDYFSIIFQGPQNLIPSYITTPSCTLCSRPTIILPATIFEEPQCMGKKAKDDKQMLSW